MLLKNLYNFNYIIIINKIINNNNNNNNNNKIYNLQIMNKNNYNIKMI